MDPIAVLVELYELIKSVGDAAAIFLVVWLVKRMFTNTIPRLAQTFKDTIGEQTLVFKETNGNQRDEFLKQLDLMNIRHDARVETMEQRFIDEIRIQRQENGHKIEKISDLIRDKL